MQRRARPRLDDRTLEDLAELVRLPASSERAADMRRELERLLPLSALIGQRPVTGQPPRGAPANDALMELIRGARGIFRRHYRDRLQGRLGRGFVQNRASGEQRELQFVQTVLLAARALPASRRDDRQYLAGLVNDSRCTVDRKLVVERVAKKVQRSRLLANALAKKIDHGELADRFTTHDVVRRQWRDLRTRKDVQTAIRLLVRAGRLQPVKRSSTPRGGRPTKEYRILPALRKPPRHAHKIP
jgi:hypothetical protein